MSLWSRIVNVFRTDRLHREIEEEFQSHMKEAIAAILSLGQGMSSCVAAFRLMDALVWRHGV